MSGIALAGVLVGIAIVGIRWGMREKARARGGAAVLLRDRSDRRPWPGRGSSITIEGN